MNLPGTEVVCVEALGVPIRIAVDDPDLAQSLRVAWEWCLADLSEPPAATISAAEGLADVPAEAVLEHVTQLVTIEAVGQRAGDLLMLHACAVADPETGEAVVLVGPSGIGKTTLAAALGTRWTYLSDETAGITASGELVPYPKPLSVRSAGHPGKDQVSPAALGLLRHQGIATVKAVFLLDRVMEGSETLVQQVPTVPAIALLAEHTSYLKTLPRPLHRLAALLNETGGLRRVTYVEAADVAGLVAEVLGVDA